MDFDLSDDLARAAGRGREVGLAAAAPGRGHRGHAGWSATTPTFSLELGKRGWLGMTWPVEVGGGGRPPIERLLVFEQLISRRRAAGVSWFADRQMGPTLLQFGTAEQQAALPARASSTARQRGRSA